MDQNFHLIEKYFQGKLNEEELQLFNEKLQSDPSFEQEFRDMKLISDGVKETARHKTLSILQSAEANISKKETTKINVSMKRLVSIAASLVVIATVSYFAISSGTGGSLTGDEIYNDYFTHYVNLYSGTERNNTSLETTTLSARAYNAYDIKDYSTSANLFDKLLEDEKNEFHYLYSGISNLKSGNTEVAKERFNIVMNNYSNLQEQAQWYLTLALFKEGSESEATANAASLIASNSSYNRQANKLLADLNLTLENGSAGQVEDIKIHPINGNGTEPDGSEFLEARQYQFGSIKSLTDSRTIPFWNETPIYELEKGDIVEYVVIRGKSSTARDMAVIIDKVQ